MPGSRGTPPLGIQAYRGPNHILVSRRNSFHALHKRANKLLDSGRWSEVHIHGLGAALAVAISLAAVLVQESGGRIVAWATTSTEQVVDYDDGTGAGSVRYNSALHVCLRKST